MQGLRDFGNALVAALLSIGLTLGALSISLVGFVPEEAPPPTLVLLPSPIPVTATQTLPPTATLDALISTPTFTATNTVIPPTYCQPPAGWIPITLQAGDTFESLAARYATSPDLLKSSNCLFSNDSLITGTLIYVPPAPTSTVRACISGAVGWIKNYSVKPKDTLYSIASSYGSTVDNLKRVNCRSSDVIYVGELLWVPNVPTRTPTITPLPGITFTAAPSLTEPFTQTVLPFTATFEPTATLPPPTATPVPTQTGSPTAFPTPTP